MSDCKINQNMDAGDIIYLVIAFFLMILGFFNKSKEKRKEAANKSAQNSSAPYPPIPTPTLNNKENRDAEKKRVKPPPPPKPIFQSSLDLVTDFEGESSLKGFKTEKDLAFSYEEKTNTHPATYHPAIMPLLEEDTLNEIRKALIYKEVLDKKF